MDCSLPGSSVHGILQARILVWVAISFFRDLFYCGIKPMSLASPASATRLYHCATWENHTFLGSPSFSPQPVGFPWFLRGHPMASPTWWTWIWASSGSCWSTGKPGVLQSTGSQRVGHDWVTELNWTEPDINVKLSEIRKQSYAYRIMFAVSWKFQLCNRFFSS